jgi:hypothetical protein
MTGQQVVTFWRGLVSDSNVEYRYSDTLALELLNLARQALASDRPDLLLDTDGTLDTITDLSALSETDVFNSDSKQALAYYMASLIYEREGTDENNLKRSADYERKYRALI